MIRPGRQPISSHYQKAHRAAAGHYLKASQAHREDHALYEIDLLHVEKSWNWISEEANESELVVAYALAFESSQSLASRWRETVKWSKRGVISAEWIKDLPGCAAEYYERINHREIVRPRAQLLEIKKKITQPAQPRFIFLLFSDMTLSFVARLSDSLPTNAGDFYAE
ncbi:MAG: hypothetical protein SF339_02395 [Blastocatellia bacterium]|nr:hypothetical protein [Blastocatellia bacterium]